MSIDLATKIAEDVYNMMLRLRSHDGSWVVDPHEFLPANVTCDFAGMCKFKRLMAETVEAAIQRPEHSPE